LYAVYLNSMGRFEEAEAEIKTAIDLEPASALNHRLYGMVLYFARRFDESIVENQRAVEIDADFRTAYWALVEAYRMKGDDDKAFEWFLRAPHRKDEPPEKLQFWKEIYAKSGWRGILQRQIKEALEKNGKTPVVGNTFLANSYAELGDWEQALNYLEKGVAERRGWLWIKVNPKFDPLHGNPRFDALLRRVGLK
jgi:tetratricopeptide (TPR) repeat protein